MADTKISAMTGAAAIAGTEQLPVIQLGANVQTTVNALSSYLTLPIVFLIAGLPATGQVYNWVLPIPVTLPANLAGTVVYDQTLPTSSAAFTVNKISGGATTSIGTVTITSTSHTSCTLSVQAATTFAAGDVLQLVAPTRDATLADITITFLVSSAVVAGATLDLNFLTGTLDPSITFTRSSVATYFDASGVLQTAISGAPRFDYDPVTHVVRGLLMEEARTNLALQSQFGGAVWAQTGAVLTANTVTSPDGGTTAATLREDASTNHNILQTITKAASVQTYAISFFAKAGTGAGRNVQHQIDDGTGVNAVTFTINPVTGAVLSWAFFGTGWSSTAPAYQPLLNGWGRYSLSVTTAAVTTLRLVLFMASGTANTYTGDNASTVLIYGYQCELAAFPTSYIPTTTVTATRAADVATITSPAGYASNQFSWSAQVMVMPGAPGGGRAIGSTTNIIGPLFFSSAYAPGIIDGVALVTTVSVGSAGVVMKAATNINGTVCSSVLNGGAVISAGGFTNGFGSLTTTRLMGDGAGELINGWMQRATFWPRVLSNGELQQVTL